VAACCEKNANMQKSKKAKKKDAKKIQTKKQKSKKLLSVLLETTPTTAIYYYQKCTYRRSWIS
jgi:hypothetical protein